jgi:hypothetical protein
MFPTVRLALPRLYERLCEEKDDGDDDDDEDDEADSHAITRTQGHSKLGNVTTMKLEGKNSIQNSDVYSIHSLFSSCAGHDDARCRLPRETMVVQVILSSKRSRERICQHFDRTDICCFSRSQTSSIFIIRSSAFGQRYQGQLVLLLRNAIA